MSYHEKTFENEKHHPDYCWDNRDFGCCGLVPVGARNTHYCHFAQGG